MSTAHATITFHHTDPSREPAILAALRVHGFRFEYIDAVIAPLRRFRAYGTRDAGTMICEQLAALMRRLDPSAVFSICQDPNHEFVGQMLVSDPDLGDYCCPADEEATPLLPAREVRRGIDSARHAVTAGVDPAAAFAELDRLTGGPWWRRLERLRTPNTVNPAAGTSSAAA